MNLVVRGHSLPGGRKKVACRRIAFVGQGKAVVSITPGTNGRQMIWCVRSSDVR